MILTLVKRVRKTLFKTIALRDRLGSTPNSLQIVTAVMKLKNLLLGRKVMTNLYSILKSRDITFPTKVHLLKGMVFPVVKYECESWTIKKAECEELMLLNCGVAEDS